MNIKIDLVPQKPGVYIWMDKYETILYIGKAKNLKKRMQQYFKGMLNSYKTAQLVQKIASYNIIITKTDKEALILERNLIQKHLPSYNILLTDDKRYPYIRVKLGKKLEINLVYRVMSRLENATYFGPFPFGYGARKLTNLVQRLVLYKNGLPVQNESQAFWAKKYEYAKQLLSSQNSFLIRELEQKMVTFASNFQYELAADLKANIEALKQNKNKQLVEIQNHSSIDVIAFVQTDEYLFVAMLFYRNGILLSRKQKTLEIIASKSDLIRQFISQYYRVNIRPDLIISNETIETDLKVIIPRKGKNKQILDLAIANAEDNKTYRIEQYKAKEKRTTEALSKLAHLLEVKKLKRIIMIDNSNTNNSEPVSGIVSYVNGTKQPSEYRKFALEPNNRLGDVEYMRQGLVKYFRKTPPVIDLLIVDGGKQQINEARKVVPSKIIVCGLVKNEHHQTRDLLDENGNVLAVKDQSLWLFLNGIQIEADRYAKSYHTQRRKNTSLEGFLITIQGVGPKTENKLLSHFQNYAAIYNAPLKELEKIVSKVVAKKIKEALHANNSHFR